MLTEQFLNMVCTICTYDHDSFNISLIRDLENIVDFYENDDEEIPLICKMKFSLSKALIKLKIAGGSSDSIIDNVKACGKFESIETFISTLENKKLSEIDITNIIKHVRLRKKIVSSLGTNYSKMRRFVDDFDHNAFSSIDEAMQEYEKLITHAYSSYSSERRNEQVLSIQSLNLSVDDYNPVIKQIEDNYSGRNSVPSGFPSFDTYLNGGFEPGRLYIFGGASNSGKSTWMINVLRGAMNYKRPPDHIFNPLNKADLYAFITLEDFIDESVLRLYCSEKNRNVMKVVRNIKNESNHIKSTFEAIQENNNTIMDMTYFVPTTVSTADIILHLEELKQKFAKKAILRGVYIDYLDLLKSGQKFDMHRLEIGQIAIDLKVLASSMGVPVITLTQLNRSAYDSKEKLTLGMMGESIKKVEHADFVALLKSDADLDDEGNSKDTGWMEVSILKNRGGPKNKIVKLRHHYPEFRLQDTRGVAPDLKFDETVVLSSDEIL